MYIRRLIVTAALWLAAVGAAAAADIVAKQSGSNSGEVTAVSERAVTVRTATGQEEILVNTIRYITFDADPVLLKTARTAVLAGRYEDAIENLGKINPAEVTSKFIQQDIDFFKALAAARLALKGSGDPVKAGQQMVEFLRNHPESYHYYEAAEMIGDLLVAAGKPGAQTYYDKVASAPWPEYKMRANVAAGKALLAEGKPQEALPRFEQVLSTTAAGPAADAEKLAATLGKGRCLAAAGQHDEAVKLIDGVLASADPEEATVNAAAYNALGDAYRRAGKPKDALLAYLHVDVLYFNAPREHIEALKNLAGLWKELQKPDRAEQAQQILRDRYKVTAP